MSREPDRQPDSTQNPYAPPALEELPAAPPLKFVPTRKGWFARATVVLMGCGHAGIGLGTLIVVFEMRGALIVALAASTLGLFACVLGLLFGLGSVIPFFYDLTKNAHALGLKYPTQPPARVLTDFIPPFAAWQPVVLSQDLARGLGHERRYPAALALWWHLWLIALGSYVLAPYLIDGHAGLGLQVCLSVGSFCGTVACFFAYRVFWNLDMGMREKAGLPSKQLI